MIENAGSKNVDFFTYWLWQSCSFQQLRCSNPGTSIFIAAIINYELLRNDKNKGKGAGKVNCYF